MTIPDSNTLLIIYAGITFLLSGYYIYIIYRYLTGWKKLSSWNIPIGYQPKTSITILIPARNEETNILPCLHSILKQNYPETLYEVIVIDDHSTDSTASLVQKLAYPNVRVLKLVDHPEIDTTQSFKKKAIEWGISQAKGELILTTDADCETPPQWLEYFASFYENTAFRFIAAPVNFYREKNGFERFQSLDFIGMMGVTGAGISEGFMHMCNGANLGYEKKLFYEVGGFEGIDQLASGDDILLMQKVALRYPGTIGYLKNAEATVHTLAKPDLVSFLNQRIRWATKSKSYGEWKVTFILAMVFSFCWNIILSFFLIPFVGVIMAGIFLFQLFIKGGMDYFFQREMISFFKRKELMRSFLPALFLHILYIAVVGLLGNLKKKYTWKGRQVQ